MPRPPPCKEFLKFSVARSERIGFVGFSKGGGSTACRAELSIYADNRVENTATDWQR